MIATALFQAITVLVHGTLIDGTGAAPRGDTVVEIRDGTITAIARAENYVVPEGASVIDVTGKWILPGYIDTQRISWTPAVSIRAPTAMTSPTTCLTRPSAALSAKASRRRSSTIAAPA